MCDHSGEDFTMGPFTNYTLNRQSFFFFNHYFTFQGLYLFHRIYRGRVWAALTVLSLVGWPPKEIAGVSFRLEHNGDPRHRSWSVRLRSAQSSQDSRGVPERDLRVR